MTRESLKNNIDLIPDRDLDAFVLIFNAFLTRVKTEDDVPVSEDTELKWYEKHIPEKVTHISQLFGTLPDISLDEIRMRRISDV
ncbi:MAG: hypothetical protein LBM59_03385 [Ruminococcus sp.]|jgi:hypothetical protein|nr:hypothetical protein [Ruminococcus sp.]